MNFPLEPLKAVPCTIPGCYNSFDTVKDMQRHKHYEPTHFYCRKCDVDCEDWADLLEHKVEAMAPFLEKRADQRPPGNPPHLVCEFCGEDFKSMGGRMLHRERYHQADQSIKCPGYHSRLEHESPCNQIFTRAGAMIAHLEDDECEAVRSWEFLAQIQHKYVKKEIMKDLESFTEALAINSAFAPCDEPGLIDDNRTPVATDTDTDGGVLLDHEDEEQKIGTQPLEAKMASIHLGGKSVPLTRSNLEAWPRLPGQAKSIVSEDVLNKSIGSPPPSIISTNMSASQFASEITSRRGGVKVHTEYSPSPHDSHQPSRCGTSTNDADEDDAASVSTAKAENVLGRQAAWIETNTSRALFGDVKAPPQTDEIKSILKKHRESEEKAPNLLLNARWWDPTSDDYNPDRFWHSVLEKYCCPFKATCDVDSMDNPYDISRHLMEAHAKVQFRCPGCLKIFRKVSGMVSHMEMTSKCGIKQSKSFKSVLDDITGGFVEAQRLPQPKVYRTTDVIKYSETAGAGVMGMKYERQGQKNDEPKNLGKRDGSLGSGSYW